MIATTSSLARLGGRLDRYMQVHGKALQHNALASLAPGHVPGRDPVYEFELYRTPFPAQAECVTAGIKALKKKKTLIISGEMGTGKTFMGQATIHGYSLSIGRPNYRCIIYCPGQLVTKWERELKETIPNVEVHQIRKWTDLKRLHTKERPARPTFYILPRDKGKLGAKWRGAGIVRKMDTVLVEEALKDGSIRKVRVHSGYVRCPKCGQVLFDKKEQPIRLKSLNQKITRCDNQVDGQECGEPMFQFTSV